MPLSGSLDTDGLGTLTWTTSVIGAHSFLAFFDYEIDEPINTFFNEYGDSAGTLASGQSWEIDEPGYVFGDIYDNVLAGTLDNFNNVPAGLEDDVSMAMGWDFTLNVDETAIISLILTDDISEIDTSQFYLSHTDPESVDAPYTVYFSSILSIESGPVKPVPEPGTILLTATALAGLFGWGTRRSKK